MYFRKISLWGMAVIACGYASLQMWNLSKFFKCMLLFFHEDVSAKLAGD